MVENHPSVSPSGEAFIQAPPPWELQGEGIMLVYKFSKSWIETHGQIPSNLAGKYLGGLGFVMLVSYEKSPVGPYHELLLIPGKFGKSKKQVITKIYVDSEASTQNGRANWGIPKETLPFSWKRTEREDFIEIKDGEKPVFSCEIKSWGISFPTSTALLPIDLQQEMDNRMFLTKPTGRGKAKFAKIKNLFVDPDYFPDITKVKPLFAVKIKPFRINFPTPSHGIEKL
jgi:hypothetical protein